MRGDKERRGQQDGQQTPVPTMVVVASVAESHRVVQEDKRLLRNVLNGRLTCGTTVRWLNGLDACAHQNQPHPCMVDKVGSPESQIVNLPEEHGASRIETSLSKLLIIISDDYRDMDITMRYNRAL
jgi:hypothetical protein